jgi:hypothetical protein
MTLRKTSDKPLGQSSLLGLGCHVNTFIFRKMIASLASCNYFGGHIVVS